MKNIILLIIYLIAIVLFSSGISSIGKELTQTEQLPQEDSLIEKYKRMAAEGDTSAMNRLGQSYSVGEGVPQDDTKAVEWFRKAAEAGNSQAMLILGQSYYLGIGVPQDDTKAVEWFRKAAEAGNSQAMLDLGRSYNVGRGVPQDDKKAVEWFRKAVEAGNSDAMVVLGGLYMLGHKVPRDDVKANKLFQRAADAGNLDAKNLLSLGDLTSVITSPREQFESLNQLRKKAKAGDEFAKKILWRLGYSHRAWLDRLIAIATSLGISAILMIVVYMLPRNNKIL